MHNKTVIADRRITDEALSTLRSLGYRVVKTAEVPALYPEVRSHTDMQITPSPEGVICAPEVFGYYRQVLKGIGIICGSKSIGTDYPSDIAYNVCPIGEYIICKSAYTAPEIISAYKGRTLLETRQGYAKCSICVVGQNAAVTSDKGLYKLMTGAGIDVLKIRPGHIALSSAMEGFIGGASGLLEDGLLCFNGDIKTHPDGDDIVSFCRSHGTDIVCLTGGMLTDIGTVMRV